MEHFRRVDENESESHSVVYVYSSQCHVVTVELAWIYDRDMARPINYPERMRKLVPLMGEDGTERGYLIRCLCSSNPQHMSTRLCGSRRRVYVESGPRSEQSVRIRYQLDTLLDLAMAYVPSQLTVIDVSENAREPEVSLVLQHLRNPTTTNELQLHICPKLRAIGSALMKVAVDRAAYRVQNRISWNGETVAKFVRADTGWTNWAQATRPRNPADPESILVCPRPWCGHWFPNTKVGTAAFMEHRRMCRQGVHDPTAPVVPGFLPLLGPGVQVANQPRTRRRKLRAANNLARLYGTYASHCATLTQGLVGPYASELQCHSNRSDVGPAQGTFTHYAAVQTLDGRVFWSESPALWVRLAGLTHAVAVETAARMIYALDHHTTRCAMCVRPQHPHRLLWLYVIPARA